MNVSFVNRGAGSCCNGKVACVFAGNNKGSTVIQDTCSLAGDSAEEGLLIGSGSCNGIDACLDVGGYSYTRVEVKDGSCNGEDACLYINDYDEAGDTIVLGDSCNGYRACSYLCQYDCASSSIGPDACNGVLIRGV